MSFDFEPFPVLHTERLTLRRITFSDAPAWLTVLGDPAVTRYLSDVDAPLRTQDEVAPLIEWANQIYANKTGIRWALTLTGSPTLIGTCGFHALRRQSHRAEIGYELGSAHWRKGYMHEAMIAVVDFCFNTLQLNRLEADVTDGNEASAGVLQRLGFTHEGTWREAVYTKGQFQNLWQYGLLAREYRAQATGTP